MKKHKGTLFRLFKILPKKIYFILGIIFLLGLSSTEIISAYFIQEMTNAAVERSLQEFYPALILLIVITVGEMIFSYLRTRMFGVYSESGLKMLREKLSHQYNALDMETFTENHTGDYVSRATNDVNKVKDYLTNVFPGLIWNPITGVAALSYLLYLNWKLTLISVFLIPVVFILINFLGKPLSKISRTLQEKLASANAMIQDYIKGVEVSKAYHLEEVLAKDYMNTIDESVDYGKKIALRKSVIESVSSIFSIIPFLITNFLGGYYVIQGQMSIGGLLAFINLLNYVTNPIMMIPRLITRGKVDLAACDRIFEVLDSKQERTDGISHAKSDKDPVIQFDHVSFCYKNKTDMVLHNISFAINKGEKIALVGPSGGGKSTLMQLLLGYYDHYQGEIKIFGQEMHSWNLFTLRNHIALVSQDTYLFPDSVRENISYGKYGQSITEEDIINSAKAANADSFVRTFQNGYETPIGELGNRLSGGQKQRISIARAVAKNAEILLLDEATSSLDNESEHLVQTALEHLMENKTSIVIAHRLSTIKNVDRIFVIDEGRIVEAGSHEALLSQDGLYTSLYQKQMKLENEELVA